MEVILVTQNKKYAPLVRPSKIIENSYVDISSILITEVFLNHHYNIAFYVLKDNISNQFQLPVKISKQLLDRNQGPIELIISGKSIEMSIKSESENQLMEAFTKAQFQFYERNQDSIIYDFHFWDIRIKLVILEGRNQDSFKKLIISNQSSKIHKVILFIDKSNFHYFTNWIEEDSKTSTFSSKLSKEYITLKSEIQNEKQLFKNKVKVVQALIGESINVQKLLVEEKEENSEFKRLKETFQTIRNIDNVLLEQERRIQLMRKELIEKRTFKQEFRYSQAQMFTKANKEIHEVKKQIELLQYKIKYVQPQSEQFKLNKIFSPSPLIQKELNEEVSKFKKNFLKKNNQKMPPLTQKPSSSPQNKGQSKTLHSYSQSKEFSSFLKKKIVKQENQKRQTLKNKSNSELCELSTILKELYKYFRINEHILTKINSKSEVKFQKVQLDLEDFPILEELMKSERKQKPLLKKRNTLEDTLLQIMISDAF